MCHIRHWSDLVRNIGLFGIRSSAIRPAKLVFIHFCQTLAGSGDWSNSCIGVWILIEGLFDLTVGASMKLLTSFTDLLSLWEVNMRWSFPCLLLIAYTPVWWSLEDSSPSNLKNKSCSGWIRNEITYGTRRTTSAFILILYASWLAFSTCDHLWQLY